MEQGLARARNQIGVDQNEIEVQTNQALDD